jgi:hypothetical protein
VGQERRRLDAKCNVAAFALDQQPVQVTVTALEATPPRNPSFVGCGKFALHWYVPKIAKVAV